MAEGGSGIDRKAEERMEFSTSKEVTVHPTFESMSLKGEFSSVQSNPTRQFLARPSLRSQAC